jgi:HK97 family phage major capsid protein
MPKMTPDQLAAAAQKRADELYKKEYEVPAEAKEVLEAIGADPNPKLDDDSIDKLFSDVDEVKKSVVVMNERLAELRELKGGQIPAPPDDKPKFESLGDMYSAVRDKIYFNKDNEILKTTGYLEEGQGSLGGFTVPEEYVAQLLSVPLQQSVMLPNSWVIKSTTNRIAIPRIVDTSHSSDVYGGVTGGWTAEGGSISLSNPSFGQVPLIAKKLALLTYLSNELYADNVVGLDAVLRRIFSEALSWFLDKGFIKGSGVNEPLGLTNAACIDNINTTASHFYVEDAATMYANLLPSSFSRAIWIMNPTLKAELLTMESLGNSRNMWFRDIIKVGPEPWTLLGRPIFFSEFCAALGTSTDVLLVDPTMYIILDRQQVVIDVSTEARFANDETGYRLKCRYDGQPWVASTLTLADGSTTVSPIVNSHHA